MAAYLEKAQEQLTSFFVTSIAVILRSKNSNVHALAKLALTKDAYLLDAVSMEYLAEPSIHPQPRVMELTQEPSYIDPIVAYLKTGEQPEHRHEAHIFQLKAACYVLYDNKLYRRGYSMPLLKCATPSEVKYIIKEIYEGTCGNQAGGQSLAFKALRQGYYLPTMMTDCMEYARKCDKC